MWATPVPQVKDLAELNDHLRRCCLQARERTCGTNRETVGVRFEHDRSTALSVTTRPFEACLIDTGSVDKYQTVAFDSNRYSVPRRHAFRTVTVKGFIDRVEIVADQRIVATHARSYGRQERVLDPPHFLVILERKPAALDHAPVYRDWRLPPAFAQLRRRLEADRGQRTGARQYIRVLQLLARFPRENVERAITQVVARGDPSAAAITTAVERQTETAKPPSNLDAFQVPAPDLNRFNRLLSDPGDDHDRDDPASAQGELEAVEAADDAGRT